MLMELELYQHITLNVGYNGSYASYGFVSSQQIDRMQTTHNCNLSAELILDFTLFDSLRCLISNNREELLDTHLGYLSLPMIVIVGIFEAQPFMVLRVMNSLNAESDVFNRERGADANYCLRQ